MAADLMTRILMDDKQFNNTLEKSKNQLSHFKEFVGAGTGMITKMAGAFGVAASATEAFRKIIDSTQGNTDRFNSKMEQGKAVVDSFFDSIAIGDFGNMLRGFDKAIARARELYDAMDTLGDMQAGWTDVENEYRTKINENIAAIYDTNTPLADRKAMMEENKKYIALLERKSKGIIAQTATAVVATARREAQMDNVTEEDVKRYLQGIPCTTIPSSTTTWTRERNYPKGRRRWKLKYTALVREPRLEICRLKTPRSRRNNSRV